MQIGFKHKIETTHKVFSMALNVAPMATYDNTSDRRTFLKVVGGATGVSALAGCLGGDGSDEGNQPTEEPTEEPTEAPDGGGNQEETLRVGIYGPLSGPAADIGEAMRQGAELAAERINADGGVAGATIELFFGDSESDPAQGRSAVEFLIDRENVDLIAGGFHSDVTLAVVEVTHDRGIPQMISNSVSGAINAKIVEQDMRNVFKMSPPSEAYGLGWAQLLGDFQEQEIGYFPFENQRVAMIGEDTSYGLSVMDASAEYLRDAGWDVISTDDVAVDESNFSSLLTRIRANDPDIVWAVQTAPSAAANLIKQFRQTGFEDTHFVHSFAPSNPETINLAGDAADGVLWMANVDIIPQFVEDIGLAEAWQEAYGTDVPGSSGSLPYDNLYLVRQAIEDMGGVGELDVETWHQAVVDMEPQKGSAGIFDFEDDGQAKWGVDYIPAIGFQIQNGDSQVVWPLEVAETEVDESYYE